MLRVAQELASWWVKVRFFDIGPALPQRGHRVVHPFDERIYTSCETEGCVMRNSSLKEGQRDSSACQYATAPALRTPSG